MLFLTISFVRRNSDIMRPSMPSTIVCFRMVTSTKVVTRAGTAIGVKSFLPMKNWLINVVRSTTPHRNGSKKTTTSLLFPSMKDDYLNFMKSVPTLFGRIPDVMKCLGSCARDWLTSVFPERGRPGVYGCRQTLNMRFTCGLMR